MLISFSLNAEEYNLREELLDSKEKLSVVISELKKELPFTVNQDLAYFRVRLAKHPKIVNRSDEVNWVKHDLFEIKEIKKTLDPYKEKTSVTELFQSLDNLSLTYQAIVDEYSMLQSL